MMTSTLYYNLSLGVPLIDGGTIRLPALIGLSRALDLILTGREVDAKEGFDIGECINTYIIYISNILLL